LILRGVGVDIEAGRSMTFSHIRAAQWKLTLGTEDLWAAFCRAAADWSKEKKGSSLEPLEDVVGQDGDEDDDCQLEDDPAEVISMRERPVEKSEARFDVYIDTKIQ
jgi:hypothetical protein